MSKVSLYSTVVRTKDQVSTHLGGDVVILALNSGEYYSLEDVGARIWDIIQDPKTVKEVLDISLHEYDVESEGCKRNLLELLQELANAGLVEVKDEAVT